MQTSSFIRIQCWQDTRISSVINTEAASVDRANFLATHVPLEHIHYERSPQHMSDTSEEGLLAELWARATNDQHTFAVIQGIPGTGKSHLIRWLKERYTTANFEHSGNEVILFVERAQCNLRSTLEQIIRSGVFDSTTMTDHLRKLQGATLQLSKAGLADNILHQLHVATGEVTLRPEDQPLPRIKRGIYKFLLDYNVREALKRSGGPVDRIIRFLAEDNSATLGRDELPGFQPQDFDFTTETLRAIRDRGEQDTRELADSLHIKYELQVQLASYLNRLLNDAIGRTTALSAEELKQMFNELRRELRRQGRRLALFIEDITAFTGIDAGLVDVLATQHTGETTHEFCRLLSVIGITDSYYRDRFPDNIRERISHHLTLNATRGSGQSQESDLLQRSEVVAALVARYLNAMRLDQIVLDDWLTAGAHADTLPNACVTCRFRVPCHAAFGAIGLDGPENELLQVGLYPFNRQAVNIMYQNLTSNSHTPRSLLNSVLEYVLQSYGPLVRDGKFPPTLAQLGSHFKAPSWGSSVYRQTVLNQAGGDALRVESLLLFWGDRTVNAVERDGQLYVGGLSTDVFTAFATQPITGEVNTVLPAVTTPAVLPPVPVPGETISLPVPVAGGTISPPVAPVPVPPSPDPPAHRKLADDIDNWARGGTLENYQEFPRLLAGLFETFIDWQAYGIGALQLSDRLAGRRFYIEGQAGRSSSGDYYTFKRSSELSAVLHALVELGEGVEQRVVGTHLANLSTWVRSQEAAIVAFVSVPLTDAAPPVALSTQLVLDSLLIEALGGGLKPMSSTPVELYLDLISSCASTTPWNKQLVPTADLRSARWSDLCTRLDADNKVAQIRAWCLVALNCPQGDFSMEKQKVRFLDAATALDILGAFVRHGWTLPAWESPGVSVGKNWPLAWSVSGEIYLALREHFAAAIAADVQQMGTWLDRITILLGGESAEVVFAAIRDLEGTLRQYQHPHNFVIRDLSPNKLRDLQAWFTKVTQAPSAAQQILHVSSAGPNLQAAREYRDYLDRAYDFVAQTEQKFAQQRKQEESQINAGAVDRLAEREYEEIEALFSRSAEKKSA